MKKCNLYHQTYLLKHYLHGTVSSKKNEIELHLKTCTICAETVERLKQGERYARSIAQTPEAPDVWKRLEDSIDANSTHLNWKEQKRIAAIAAVVIVAAGVIFWSFAGDDSSSSFSPRDRIYTEVRLSRISENTEAHIVTEGVVSEIAIQDGDYRIKLQENLRQSGPFVICEILRPSKIRLPEVGKKVRVYGVSRFDSKPEHRWYEVHPVFGIETVQENRGERH